MRLLLLITGLCFALSAGALDLPASADQVRPLLPGMKVPSFELRDVEGRSVTVDPAKLEKPLILTFYRGGWCPYCNLHLAELRTAEEDLREMGYDVWFISADKPELLYESLKQEVDYQIYSDASLSVASTFGIAFRLDDSTIDRYRSYGLDLEEVSGEKHRGLPAPATFIIGTDGVIQFQYTNPDYSVRLAPNVLLAAAEAYQQDAHSRLRRERGR